MKPSRILITLATLCIGTLSLPTHAAVLYQFSGISNNGTGSATMLVDIVGNTLTAKINNTSPNPSPNPTDLADPAITGLGFQFTNAPLIVSSWCLSVAGTNISGTCAGSTNDWVGVIGKLDGVVVDFGSQTNKGVKGGLYAPGADDLGGPPRYFGEAIFTAVFNTAPSIEELTGNCNGANAGCSPFLRFQNVGINGGGSLKLPGTTFVPPPTDVPEPGTLLLVGLLLTSLGFARRRA